MKRLPILLLLQLIATATHAQTAPASIAVIEQNNFRSVWQHQSTKPRYSTWLRPLFIKTDTGWAAITKYPQKATYYAGNTKVAATLSPHPETDTEGINQYSGLYHIQSAIPPLKHFPEPDRVFEEKDILHYQFVSNHAGMQIRDKLKPAKLYAASYSAINASIKSRLDLVGKMSPIFNVLDSSGKSHQVHLASGPPISNGYQYLAWPLISNINLAYILGDSKGNKLFAINYPSNNSSFPGAAFSLTGFREDNGTPLKIFGIIRPSGTVKLFFADMRLLTHADYDGDGQDEYLFFYSIFNHYGYILVYDDFNRYVDYTWSYH